MKPIRISSSHYSEPSIRGILSTSAGIAYTNSMMFVFVLGAFLSWREAAMVCFCAPWITAFAISFVSKIATKSIHEID